MRRSCAPSMKLRVLPESTVSKTSRQKRTSSGSASNEVSSSTSVGIEKEQQFVCNNNCNFTKKHLFNIVWRKITTKKHKTWEGDGLLEVRPDGHSCVLKDESGKYLGSSNVKFFELTAGTLLVVSGKEVEIQDKILDVKAFYENRKLMMNNRDAEWECSEPMEKKPKCNFNFFLPKLTLSAPKIRAPPVSNESQKATQAAAATVDPLILLTPEDTNDFKFNKLNRPVYEVRVAQSLVQYLRPHQRDGVVFLYECLMGFKQPDCYGVILADEMGLGKTLQCLIVTHTLLKQGPYGGDRVIQRVLIVTPSSLTANWNNEINKWLRNERMYAYIVDGKHKLQQYSSQKHIPFVIVSYEMFLTNADQFQSFDFDLLICDEGHRLKNNATKVSEALRNMNIQRKILLTGTPIQNDLQEFFMLADFVNPGVFGSYSDYRREYENPIVQSQASDSSEEVLKLGAERAEQLNNLSSRFILRRTQELNRKYLPKKREYLVFVRPAELQQFMLKKVLELWNKCRDDALSNMTPLQIITILKKICNHPSLIARTKSPNLLTRNLERHLPDWSEMGPFDSGKLEIVQNFLTFTAVERREKVILVSNHTKTLDMLQGLCDYLNLKVARLDGSTPAGERNLIVEKFNTADSTEDAALVFLLSAKAGGMGLNLVGASRLILFDNDWNPATDAQAISRIWRDGQNKDVQIYRLVTSGTIEEKIFQRQVVKLSLGGRVMDSTSAGGTMKFSNDELADLFAVPEDFMSCATHDSLSCDCRGDGRNNIKENQESNESQQINDLSNWEHYSPPFEEKFLKDACFFTSHENIQFIFSKLTEFE